MKVRVFNIQRYSIHDGPGIRTLLFLKGCSLRCLWCSNPEGIARKFQVRHTKLKCVGCGKCYEVCPEKAIVPLAPDDFYVRDEICTACGQCARYCPTEAKTMWGEDYEVDDLIKKATRDHVFYETSGGGVTLGGGEPLLQGPQAMTILSKLREMDIDTAIETCGHYGWQNLANAAPFCNTIHFDIKGWDWDLHKTMTGGDLNLIRENLVKLDELIGSLTEKPVLIVRIPLIPEFNLRLVDMEPLGGFLSNLKNVHSVEVMPFHNFGVAKYNDLGMPYYLRDFKNMHAEDIADYLKALEQFDIKVEARTW